MPGLDQTFGELRVDVKALALHVRTVVATDLWAFVPIEAEPAHRFEHDLDAFVRAALPVRVFDSQNERAAVAASPEPAVEGRPHATDVQVASG